MTIKDIGPKPQSFDIENATKENLNYRSPERLSQSSTGSMTAPSFVAGSQTR